MTPSRGEITRLLADPALGRKEALDRLFPLVYRELRRLAGHQLKAERKGHTLQPTALVHEAYLRLAAQDRAGWRDRGQFLAVAGQMMRRILVDYARARAAAKRPGNAVKVEITGIDLPGPTLPIEQILGVDEALARLLELDPRQGRVAELRYFAGLTVDETAELLQISTRTVKREWAMASAWLSGELKRAVRP